MFKFGIELIPAYNYSEVNRYAILAEKSKLEYFLVSDHIRHRNVYVCLTSIAINTKKIKIGPGVTNPYLIHPVVTAQALLSLSEIAPRRIVCGIGAGDKTALSMLDVDREKPLKAIKEAVEIIRRITNEDSLKFRGDVFRIYGAGFSFKVKANIPIFIGAQGPNMAKLAGEIGDGTLVNTANPKDFETILRQIKEGISNSEREIKDLEIAITAPFSISENKDEAIKLAKPIVARIVAGSLDSLLQKHEIRTEDAAKIKEAIMKGNRDLAYSFVTDEMLEAFSIYGTSDECVEIMDRLFELGANSFIAVLPIESNIIETIGLMKRKILPYFEQSK
ncbi:MAG: 5,10-methylenetetrahydromethanopterin reductase [archaeon]|nr:5,10-methylenetetrahydromethanopterin reductase [archaeon]MCP8314472.1 5,10-methylenetetrahydromethanopterin reductase [archaeon]MCP8321174.1 5,10-methylenetetrahydromethanopterin reductase [archaeon]